MAQFVRITVRRPNGEVEVSDRPDFPKAVAFPGNLSNPQFAKLVAGTRKAGRGEVLSAEWVDDAPPPTAEQLAWFEVLRLRGDARTAFDRRHGGDGTGLGYAASTRAEAAYKAALAAYIAAFGETDNSLARERADRAGRIAEARDSAIARGND